jgi:hypothetical protein
MNYDITLNFLPLNISNFTFTVYRRKAKPQEKSWVGNIRRYKFSENEYYWVGFNKFEQSKLFSCNSNDININLPKWYLHNLLIEKLNEQNIEIHHKKERFNKHRVYVLLDKVIDSRHNEIGEKTIWLEPYYLKSKNQFGFLVDYSFIKGKSHPFDREVQKYSLSLDINYRSNVNFNIDKYQILQLFIKKQFVLFYQLTDKISISKSFIELPAKTLKTKTYIFSNQTQNNSQFNGVMQNGPYEVIKKEPFYFYVFKKEHKGKARDLLKALNGKTYFTFKGLNKLQIPNQTKSNTKGIVINDYTKEEIKGILQEVKSHSPENPIIITLFPEKEESFYFYLKHECLKENIPVQSVHIETISNQNKLKWSVSSIAIQIFSKLGGVPWIVKPSHQNCLIVGIGKAHKYNREMKEFERFFSYSVLIDSSGKFIELKQLANETKKENFIKSISDNLLKLIQENSIYKKIIFHIPQKINREDINIIETVLKKAGSDIELSIIKINDSSKFTGYNLQKNSLVPYESSYVKISDKEYLLWTEGLNFHNKKAIKRYGNPLHVTFYYSNNEEDFKNHNAYLQDILNLSGANYRGFNAKSLPVSVYYPKLIANFSKHFKELNLNLITNDTKKPWFL